MLWAMGEGVPRDGDGRVLFEAFDPEFVDTHPLNEVDPLPVSSEDMTAGDSVEVTARLRALGYI